MKGMTTKNLEGSLEDWVIVHYRDIAGIRPKVGKLAAVNEKNIVLDVFHGSFEKGSMATSEIIPYQTEQNVYGSSGIYRVYDKECNVVYENAKFKEE